MANAKPRALPNKGGYILNTSFTIHRFEIPVIELNKPIYLLPFGDIHRDSPACDVDNWLEFCEWAKDKPQSYFLGAGDYQDLSSASERKILTSQDLHDSTRQSLDKFYRQKTEELANEISFMRGRILGLIEGNHYAILESGITTTQYLCELLGCKYLGFSSFVRMAFRYGEKKYAVDVWIHHGKGGAKMVGGSLSSVEQMAQIAEADIYLMGHDHRKSAATKSRLTLSNGNGGVGLSRRKILLARTGSFLKGYDPEKPSYIAEAGYSPTDLGVVKIELTPKRDKKDGADSFYVDLHCSI